MGISDALTMLNSRSIGQHQLNSWVKESKVQREASVVGSIDQQWNLLNWRRKYIRIS